MVRYSGTIPKRRQNEKEATDNFHSSVFDKQLRCCSGFQYKFEVDTEIDDEEDLIFENDGVKVVSDIESVKIL